MSGSATLYVEQGALGHTLGFAAMTRPTGIFLSLAMASQPPTSTTGGLEPVGMGYARQPAAFALLSSPPNIAGNTGTVQFPAATANWGDVGFFEVWDALSAGNRLYWGPLVDPTDGVTPIIRSVFTGDIVRLQAGTVQVRAT